MVGFQNKVGEVRTFDTLSREFHHMPMLFDSKLYNGKEKADEEQGQGARGDDSEDKDYRSPRWQRFSTIWNEVTDDLRRCDLVSDEERGLLSFRVRSDCEHAFYLPHFLTCGLVDSAIDQSELRAEQYSHAAETLERSRLEVELKLHFQSSPVAELAINEMGELSVWLLETLLGPRHFGELGMLAVLVRHAFATSSLLAKLDLRRVSGVKEAFLSFVRGLRIALQVHVESGPTPPASSLSSSAAAFSAVVTPWHSPCVTPRGSITENSRGRGMPRTPSRATLVLLEELERRGSERAESSP